MDVKLKDIKDFPGYKAGSDGHIYSQVVRGKIVDTRLKKLKSTFSSIVRRNRYPIVALRRDGKSHSREVHVIICETFNGEKPNPSYEVSHVDGDKTNCKPENLIWETRKRNFARKIAHGTDDCGTKNKRASFNEEQIAEIRSLIASGEKLVNIAKLMKTDERNIGKIKRGERYAR